MINFFGTVGNHHAYLRKPLKTELNAFSSNFHLIDASRINEAKLVRNFTFTCFCDSDGQRCQTTMGIRSLKAGTIVDGLSI